VPGVVDIGIVVSFCGKHCAEQSEGHPPSKVASTNGPFAQLVEIDLCGVQCLPGFNLGLRAQEARATCSTGMLMVHTVP
jgi:hypothetical protein